MKPKYSSRRAVDSIRSSVAFTKSFTLGIGLVCAAVVTPSAHALAPEWNTAVSGDWTDTTKWSTAAVPIAGDTVTFNAAGQNGNQSIFLNGDQAAATLTFNNTGTTALLGGVSGVPASNVLSLAATGAITVGAGAGAVTIGDTAVSPTAPVLPSFAAAAPIINGSGATLTIANRITAAGAINTAGGVITFTGAGTDDANRSTGGALKVGSAAGGGGTVNVSGFLNATFNSDFLAVNAGTLNWNATGTIGASGTGNTVSIGGNALNANNSGTLNVTGGVLTVQAGTQTSSGLTTRSFNIGGTEQTTGTSTANGLVNISAGSLVVSNNTSILLGSGYRDQVSGSGNGTLTIGGTNALFDTGTTTGLFRLGNKSAAVGSGTININTGGTLATNRNITKGAGAGAIATVNFNGGTLKANGTALNMTGLTAVNVMGSGAIVDTNSFDATISSAFLNGTGGADGGLAKQGVGTLSLIGASTYTGATAVTDGTLQIGGAGSINGTSGITVNGATAKFVQTSSVAGTRPVNLTQGTLDGTGTVGAVTVANGASRTVANGNGTSAALTAASLAFGGAATVNIVTSAATPSARIAVTGALTTTPANGTVTITGSGSWSNGFNNLISYGSFPGAVSNFTLGTITGLTSRQTLGTLSLSGNNLRLNIIGDNPRWTGRDSTEWVVGATGANSNWRLVTAGTATNYIEGDSVLFDDTATLAVTPGSVTISAADVSPAFTAFNNSTTAYTLSGAFGIAGTGSLSKSGTAKATISTVNTFTGTVAVNAGTLNLQNSAALGNSAGASVAGGAVLELEGNVTVGAVPLTLNGAGLTASPAGALRNVSGTNSYAGLLTLGSGTTIQSDADSLALTHTGTITGSGFNLTANGAGSTSIASSIGTGSGAVIKNGIGMLSLTGASSYTGGTTVNGGILSINADAALGAAPGVAEPANITLNGATLRSSPTSLVANRGITLTNAGGTLSATGGTVNVNGKITGTGNLTIANVGGGDRIALANTTNDFTGSVLLSSGILNVNNGDGLLGNAANGLTFTANSTLQRSTSGTTTLGASRTLTINSGVTATFETGNATAVMTVNGPVAGAGGLTKSGTGTVTLAGANTYTGNTTVNAGTLSFSSPTLADASTVHLTTGSFLNLNYVGSDTVTAVFVDGVDAGFGPFNSSHPTYGALFTGTGQLQIAGAPAGYAGWAAGFPFTTGVNDGPTQDADFDGIENLLEYVFGGIPVGAGSSDAATISPVQTLTTDHLKLTFRRSDLSEADAVVKVQWSSNLTTWNDFATLDSDGDPPAVVVTENLPTSALDTVEVLIPRTNAVSGKLFGRVIATKP